MTTRTIRIFKTNTDNVSHCYEFDDHKEIVRGITHWDTISEEEYGRIDMAVRQANQLRSSKWHYFIVQQHMMADIEEIFDTAKQFATWMADLTKKQYKEEAEAKAKRQIAARARKERQLAALKAELAQEESDPK